MSRLDSFISRMTAQRDILNHINEVLGMPATGEVYEVGLGNGRTYSHLRQLFGDRRILAFDRHMGAHKTEAPTEDDIVLGEIKDTGPGYVGTGAALVHADIGTGYPEKDAVTLTWLPQLVAGMLASGSYAVSGLPLVHPELNELARLPTVEEGRYFYYKKA
ncbi:MAG: class I SAM-dependent methyltransferase [Neorhizobium sp.]|nr:class I SAM-dependent methyltransferase [Neorhizobium sp.]